LTNIWAFLLQTLSLTSAAAVILLVKSILTYNLSPKWQYALWIVFILRFFIPADPSRFILFPIGLELETVKAAVESSLSSAYSAEYLPIGLKHTFPYLTAHPQSITDFLFAVYCAGIVICLLFHFVPYFRLRSLVKKAGKPDARISELVNSVCKKYDLRLSRTIVLDNLPTAFVLGVFRPILVLPKSGCSESVILHELLHLKFHDAAQNIFFSVLKCFHWCNPFIWYAFSQLKNDMEKLCDRRALELLEGEARRQYGNTLLSMTAKRYTCVPGTSSISNGAKGISKRIASIAHFKLYPKGTALVSVCMILIIACAAIFGSSFSYGSDHLRPVKALEIPKAMAAARLSRCTTPEGAIDTYAKALILKNGAYLAAASPLIEHEAIEDEMTYFATDEDWIASHIDVGPELDFLQTRTYRLFNMTDNADGSISALLAFFAHYIEKNGELMCDSKGNIKTDMTVLIPITVSFEDAWVVRESGERTITDVKFSYLDMHDTPIPPVRTFDFENEQGRVHIDEIIEYKIENATALTDSAYSIFAAPDFNTDFNPDAKLSFSQSAAFCTYEYKKEPPKEFGLIMQSLKTSSDIPTPPEDKTMRGSFGGGSSDGYDWFNQVLDDDWDKIMKISSYTSLYGEYEPPYAYALHVYLDGELADTIRTGEEFNGKH